MIRIGVIERNGCEKLANTIRAVYGLKSNKMRYSREFSLEFADEFFFGGPASIPFISDYCKRSQILYRPSVLVVNSSEDENTELPRDIKMILVNTDEIDSVRVFGGRRGNLISYGFNSKASVTASSVRDNVVTVCIQRTLPTLSGGKIEQQEFNLTVNSEQRNNIAYLLAAVTVAMIDDV